MATGCVTWACLLLAAAAPSALPPDVVPLNSHNIKIPISIAPGHRDRIKELDLYASTDEGRTWSQVAVAGPDQDAFVFYAKADGVYWFAFQIVDAQGNRDPRDIYRSTPAQKILVDTLKPNLHITSASWQGDEIVVSWELQEENPDLATLRLDYRTPETPSLLWTQASISPEMKGQARFRPNHPGPVSVRMQVSDVAGNTGSDQLQVPARSGPATTAIAATTASTGSGTTGALPPPVFPTGPSSLPGGTGNPAPAPPVAPPGPAANVLVSSPAEGVPPPVQQASLTQRNPTVGSERPWNRPAPGSPSPAAYESTNGSSALPEASPPLPPAPSWAHNSAGPPVQITNNPQVTLDYKVTKLGPSGVGSVELYITEDEGHTWRKLADDPDLQPPMTADLPGEGIVYGLRLVVRSRAGLGGKPPQPGDPPQMRVEVDTTPPVVKIGYPLPDPQNPNALVLSWSASDRNLAPGAVSLEWSQYADGPWRPIRSGLPHSGKYVWQVAQDMPVRIYLRAQARDAAGNVGEDRTPEPVLIDLHEPEGQITRLIETPRKP